MKNTDSILPSRQAALTPPLRRTALALLISSCFGAAYANPALPQVVSGQATFNQQGNVFSITNTPNTIINWQSFSINPGELTRFIQQNANSAVLNRITGQDPSQILGALQSNGKVFLINPNGVLFGRDARVDVNGLVASSLGLSNQDFLAGKMNFNGASSAGAVSNQGSINADSGGKVLLIAPNVSNSGIITAPNGEVVLAAGHSVQLADAANPGLQVVVSAPSDQALNVGQVIAQGGKIGMYGALINQRGSLNANSAVVGDNGKIVLQASGKALLEAGSVTSASNSAGTGGQVTVLGDQVGLTGNARVDASGAKGGGTVLLGGDYQGKNAAIPNARQVFVDRDATVAADALDSGNGGKVIVWGDQTARVFGSISARGGAASGDGGFVETSGHYLAVDGIRVDTRASRGKQGNWLLDPYDIDVIAGNGGQLTDVDQFGDAPVTGATSIGAGLISNATSNVTLQALHRITFSSAINMTQSGVGLMAQAGEAINVNAAITTNGGAVKLSANDAASGTAPGATSNVNLNAAITTNGGAVTISGANVAGGGIVNVGSGNLALSANGAGGGITLTGTGDQLIGSGVVNQTVSLQADNISFSGNINFGGAASQASVSLLPWTNGRPILLGTTAANTLGLLNDQLNRISAATLNIGNSNSGNISVLQAINLAQTTTGATIKNLNLESGGNITVSNQLTMLQPDSYLQLKTGVGATLTVDSGGSLSAANMMLQADKMSLGGGAASLSGGQVTLERRSDGEIDIGSGAADSATSLGLTDTELKTIAAGHITVGGHTFNGSLNLLGSLDLSGLSSLNLLELRTSGAMNLGGPLTVAKDLMVAGNISANGAVNVGGQFTLDGGAWQQNSASLPAFYAHDFNLQNGSFLRVQGGDGSSASPYRIADIYGLQGINTLDMSNNYVLAANIDASGTANWNQGAGFSSIANGDVPGYAGTFDGAGHVISGLMVNTANLPGTSGVGLFARLKNGNVSNLSLQGGSITGRYNVGAVVGLNDGGTLNNVFSSASVTGSNAVGGLVGANSGVIGNSGASGSVTGVNSDGGAAVGGLAGTNAGSGLITVSTASGTVNGARELVGGLVGSNQATITQSYATGNVSGSRSVGGLVGSNSGSISDAYATGAVGMASGADMTLVHENLGGLAGSNSGAISNVFSSGAVNGSSFTAAIGGVVGSNVGGTLSGAYWNTDSSGQQTDNGGASGLSAEHMQQQSSFNGFNFSNSAVWRIYSGHTTPMLKAFLKPLEVNVSGAATSKVYDGQFAIFNGTLVYTGLLDGDTGANGVLGYQSARNVGSYALDGLWSTKYDISLIGANSLSITPRMLGVTVGGSKVYDGTSAFGGATYVLSNVVAGDDIHASGNAQFLDKNAGSGKTVNASGLGLSGDASGNYMLASDTASGSADISRATLNLGTVSGINKIYDGNNSAGVNAALAGVLGNDQVSLANVQASFGDKNAGHGKTINYSGSGALSGADGGNYVLAAYSGSTTADIAARALNVSFSGINKTYDGNTSAGVNISDDRVAGDALSLSGNASFADKNAGTNKTVSVSDVGVTGADAGNYVLSSHSGSTTADIAARTLNVSFSGINKTYDGNT
uniref:beta strand repeat-containing protein n=1 Tax=Janthinobacterium sp. TaxID=1871054 RepID=UPI00261E7F55